MRRASNHAHPRCGPVHRRLPCSSGHGRDRPVPWQRLPARLWWRRAMGRRQRRLDVGDWGRCRDDGACPSDRRSCRFPRRRRNNRRSPRFSGDAMRRAGDECPASPECACGSSI